MADNIPDDFDITPEDLAAADREYSILELVQGTQPDGTKVWAYINIKPSLYLEYTAKVASGSRLSVLDYGEIIESGYGEAPPEEIRQKMEKDYDADHNFSEKLKHTIDEYAKKYKTE